MILEVTRVAAFLQERLRRRLRGHPRGRRHRPRRRGRRAAGGGRRARAHDPLHPADARAPRPHHRRRARQGRRSTSRSGCTATTISSTKAVVQQGIDVRASGRAAAAGGFLLRRTAGPWRFGNYGAWVHHTPGHCPGGVCLAIGRDGDAGRDAVRRRHAVRGRDRPDRSSRRRSRRRCCGRSATCCSRSRTRRSSIRATASRRRSARNGGRTRSCSRESGQTSAGREPSSVQSILPAEGLPTRSSGPR